MKLVKGVCENTFRKATKEFPELKRCIHCGKEIADDANYCVFCMSPLIEKKEVAGLVLPGRKKRAMLWLVISGILVLLGLAAVLTVTAVRKNVSSN